MAGCDYAGFAINFADKTWTNMGYIRDGEQLISFHKHCPPEFHPVSEPGGTAFAQYPGIARYKDWWITYGYTDMDPMEFLKQYFASSKRQRNAYMLDRIVKKGQRIS